MDKREVEKTDSLTNKILMIEVKKDELLGDYIAIRKDAEQIRESIMIKIIDDDSYTLGELVITEKMRVFYNHKKRGSEEAKTIK